MFDDIINAVEHNLLENAFNKLNKRLKSYGYDKATDEDIEFALMSTREYILNYCNIEAIPNDLAYTFINLSTAYYLISNVMCDYIKLDESLSFNDRLGSITEGDVSVTFNDDKAKAEAYETLKNLIASLSSGYMSYLLKHRRLAW